jgi:hypothetical protein
MKVCATDHEDNKEAQILSHPNALCGAYFWGSQYLLPHEIIDYRDIYEEKKNVSHG